MKNVNWPNGILINKTQKGQSNVTSSMYDVIQRKPLSKAAKARSFLAAIPQILPPKAKVQMISARFVPFTRQRSFNFLNITQKCAKYS